MNYQLKSISKAGIAEALAKVELYRYLNEPEESESICRDILAIDPQQQLALRLLERALHCFAEAEKIRPSGNDDAILRWNRCVRLLQTPSLTWEEQLASLEADDAPPREGSAFLTPSF